MTLLKTTMWFQKNYSYFQKLLESGCHSAIVYLETYTYDLDNQSHPSIHLVHSA